jgi:hypothetical protein
LPATARCTARSAPWPRPSPARIAPERTRPAEQFEWWEETFDGRAGIGRRTVSPSRSLRSSIVNAKLESGSPNGFACFSLPHRRFGTTAPWHRLAPGASDGNAPAAWRGACGGCPRPRPGWRAGTLGQVAFRLRLQAPGAPPQAGAGLSADVPRRVGRSSLGSRGLCKARDYYLINVGALRLITQDTSVQR